MGRTIEFALAYLGSYAQPKSLSFSRLSSSFKRQAFCHRCAPHGGNIVINCYQTTIAELHAFDAMECLLSAQYI